MDVLTVINAQTDRPPPTYLSFSTATADERFTPLEDLILTHGP